MIKIAIALAIILISITVMGSSNRIVIHDDFRAQVVCIDGMKFAAGYSYSSNSGGVHLVQIMDVNGKPKACPKYEEDK